MLSKSASLQLQTCTKLQANPGQLTTHCLFSPTHPAIYVGDFNSHYPDWGYQNSDVEGETLSNWASCGDLTVIHDPKQKGTFHSARWQQDYSLDLCWVTSANGHPQPATHTMLDDFLCSQH